MVPVMDTLAASRRASLWLAATVWLVACDRDVDSNHVAEVPLPTASFVGVTACAECHAAEAGRWEGSHHDDAMQVANADSVRGDFDSVEFTHGDVTSTFFRREAEYWVNTDGPSGELQDFRITHTFGVEPLQQYLIELPGGRHQALSIAWDTRPVEQGGQRWFHLYPEGAMTSDDALHWTGTYQNWNTMCAACHSTNLRKGYDPESDQFQTVWSSIDVACEACHGPGSNHVDNPSASPAMLGTVARAWVFAQGARIAELAVASSGSAEIEVCAQCHSRRAQLGDVVTPGQPFLDGFRPVLLETGLYHSDGQILDEVYVHGSFLQSAMAEAGVTCSDCHDPHSTELRAEGNALCTQCHLAAAFEAPEHHHHPAGSAGTKCVSCHMRAETYMVVDPRRDHSFRVPRPDLSVRLATPNACNDCHDDRTAEWAAGQVAGWFPGGRQTQFHYGEALHAGRGWAADSKDLLRRLIADRGEPAIARATAVSLLAVQLDAAGIDSLASVLNDDVPLVQLAAIEAMQNVPATLRMDYLQRYLTHSLKSLRIAAARSLVTARDQLSQRRQEDFSAALAEYLEVQRFNSDRGEGLFNQAVVLAELGQLAEAERVYLEALERDPAFSATYVNLADLYRSLGREQDAERVLETGLDAHPEDPDIRLALGLSLVRSGRLDEAMTHLDAALSTAPEAPYFAYVRAIALNSRGEQTQAIEALRSTHERFPGHRDTLFGLATILRDAGEIDAALEYAEKLVTLTPADSAARNLIRELEAARR